MKIVGPEEILKRSRKIPGGFIFVARDGFEISMAIEGQEKPLKDLHIPDLPYLDVEIYILPYRYRQRENGQWTENAPAAKAGLGWIAISPPKQRWGNLNWNYIMWHELGHQFHYQVLNFRQWEDRVSPQFLRYIELRGIQGWRWGKRVYSHSRRAEEIFADDFAHIVGGIPLDELSFLEYAGPPNEKVREYILSFIPEEREVKPMPKVYISPSTQEWNRGVGDYGTEEQRMHEIADILVPRLKAHGFDVLRGTPAQTLQQMVSDSNAWGADIHVAIHSNAAPGNARGCEVWHYTGSKNGERLARAIYKYLEALTPVPDRGVQHNRKFYELRETKAPAVIVEASFHDQPEDAKWILENKAEIAEAILHGICDYFGVKYIPPVQEKPEQSSVDVKDEIRKQLLIAKMAIEKAERLMKEVK